MVADSCPYHHYDKPFFLGNDLSVRCEQLYKKPTYKTIGRELNATISFSALNVTSKILQISDIEITHKEGDYIFKAKQLYIHYSFWQLILHKFQFTQALKEIRCFSPEIIYNALYNEEETKLIVDIEALEKTLTRFNYISIINGKVSINSNGGIVFSENLEKINASLQKQQGKEWYVKMSAFQTENEGSIGLDGVYSKQANQFKILVKDYDVPKISTNNASLISSKINAELETTLSEISKGIVCISNIESTFQDENISLKEVTLLLAPDSLKIGKNARIIWNNNVILCDGYISNYLSNVSDVNISFQIDDLDLVSLDENLSGSIDLRVLLSGNYTTPVIDIKVIGERFFYDSFEFGNLSSELIYSDQFAKITNGNFVS